MISSLGRFIIQAEIGQGGFGKVYQAFDPVMNCVVAVKTLTATDDVNALARFKNEAAAARQLAHKNIVTVYDFGQEGKTSYLVMEFLNGEDLQKIIKRGSQLSLYQKVSVMDQVADGLYFAHRNGVFHRDVKPANIMVLPDSAVKIMDFGIARLTRAAASNLTEKDMLIGTAMYMAPELFAGTEFDAPCDIWSYGVVFYELLTGKNPFQTGDLEPLPPGICPQDLHAVINKLLSRQRDFRYQSLEDTRFDLQPILKNLEKGEVDRLLAIAHQLRDQQKWSEARDIARQVRVLDPQNSTARVIFDRAQTELARRQLLPRIEEMLRQSTDLADQRKFDEALEILDKARKLDTRNEKVQVRVQEMRLLKQRTDDAAKLAGEADQEFRGNRLTSAFERAKEAVALDPANPQAPRLLEKIQNELQSRETARAADEAIRRVRGLMSVDLDAAAAALDNAEVHYPGRPEYQELRTAVAQRIEYRKRREELSRRMAAARGLVANARYVDAVADLEQLIKSFPNESEPADLLNYARQELRVQQRNDDIKQAIDSAVELGRGQRFDEALRTIEAALKKYPDDTQLTRQLRSIYADKQALERERALQDGLRQCEALRRRQEWQPALDLIVKLRAEHPASRDLAELESKITEEKNQAARDAAERHALQQAQSLLTARQPDDASMVLEVAILNLGERPALVALLSKVRAAQDEAREREQIQSELRHAADFEQGGELDTAVRIIEDALARFPKSPELLAARERLSRAIYDREEKTKIFGPEAFLRKHIAEGRRLLSAGQLQEAQEYVAANLLAHRDNPEVFSLGQDILAEKQRRQKLREDEERRRSQVIAGIQEALDQSNWTKALPLIDQARRESPDDSALLPLQADALDKRRMFLESAAATVRGKLSEGQVGLARTLFDANLAGYQDQPIVRAVAAEIAAREAQLEADMKAEKQKSAYISTSLKDASDFERKDDFPRAITTVQNALKTYPAEAELVAALRRLQAAQQQKEKDRELTAAIAEIKRHLDRGNWEATLKRLDEVKDSFPGSAELSNLEEQARKRRAREIQTLVDEARASLTLGNPGKAEKILTKSLAPFAADPAVAALATAIRDEKARPVAPKPPEPRKSRGPWIGIAALLLVGIGGVGYFYHGNSRTVQPGPNPPVPSPPTPNPNPKPPVPTPSPTVNLQPEFLRFPYKPGGVQPPSQSITVTSSAEIADPSKSAAWLTVDRVKSARPGTAQFIVRIQPNRLPPGKASYRDELDFGSGKKVPVEVVADKGEFDVSPPQLSFRYQIGDPPPAAVTLTVFGLSSAPDPKSSLAWLHVTRVSPTTFQVRPMPPDNLEAHVYPGELTFSQQQKKVLVTVEVKAKAPAPPPIDVEPPKLNFTFHRGGTPPAAQNITVTGVANIPEPSRKAAWIHLTRTSTGFSVQIMTDGLEQDHYTEDLVFLQQKAVHVELAIKETRDRFPPRTGDVTWSGGTFAPGDELAIRGQRVLKGSGHVEPKLPYTEIVVDRASLPPGVSVVDVPTEENNFTLRLRNDSAGNLFSVPFHWTRK